MASLPRITVLGSLNIDLVAYVSHHPLPGETMTANSVAVSPGGKGANQAVACAKLSRSSTDHSDATANVSMIGTVGSDSYGTLLRNNLAEHGVDVSGVSILPAPQKSGMALIVVDEPTGQNRIILSPEANHALQPEDFKSFRPEENELVRKSGGLPDLLIMQLEIPIPTVLQALRAAKEAGVPVLLNPAPAVKLPEEVYEGLAHLVVNETEASILGEVEESVLDTEEGLERVAAGFVAKGVRSVIITLGGRGVYFYRKSPVDGVVKKGLLPALKAKVVDTTGAGDTFVGQYALEVVEKGENGVDIEAAMRKASKASAKTVERAGASVSIPWRDELVF